MQVCNFACIMVVIVQSLNEVSAFGSKFTVHSSRSKIAAKNALQLTITCFRKAPHANSELMNLRLKRQTRLYVTKKWKLVFCQATIDFIVNQMSCAKSPSTICRPHFSWLLGSYVP